MIVPLADSTLDLSPPESIHLIPPQTRNMTAITMAPIIRMVMMLLTIAPKSLPWVLHILPPSPVGQGFIVPPCANAGRAGISVASDPVVRPKSFFIYLIYSRIFIIDLSRVKFFWLTEDSGLRG